VCRFVGLGWEAAIFVGIRCAAVTMLGFFLVPGVALGLSAVTSAEGVIFALIGGLITRIFVYNNWLG
jgi:hypothetical protein